MLVFLPRIMTLTSILGLALSVSAYKIPSSKKLVNDAQTLQLNSMSDAISSIAESANKAIAFVSVSKNMKGLPPGMVNPFEFFFGPQSRGRFPKQGRPKKQEGLGSGFIIDIQKGYIITNNHVVADADEITVRLSNSQTYEAKVVGKDKNTDVAVVQIKDKKFNRKSLGQLALANSDQLRVGHFVVALGAPFGLEASLSFGVVSALGRGSLSITELGDFIQTDAAINPGNSGGPLLNSFGEVVGVNTAIFSKTGAYNGIGFAIPSNLVRTVAEQLINKGSVQRGYLGVGLNRGMDPELAKDLGLKDGQSGALVSAVEPSGPAKAAGFEPGDVIVALNEKPVDNDQGLRNRIGLMRPGSKTKMKVIRNGKTIELTATLTNWPNQTDAVEIEENLGDQPFGLVVKNITSKYRKKFKIKAKEGVVITDITPNSSAERAGLQPGDVITKINNIYIRRIKNFKRAIKGKNRIQLRVWRDRRELFFPLRK